MDYSAHRQRFDPPDHHHHGYDPPPAQFYNQSTEDYYSHHRPHVMNTQPCPYNGEQEPNPPGVAPPQQHDPIINAYYRSLHCCAAAPPGGVDVGFAMLRHPIVESYSNIGTMNGVGHPQTHPALIPSFSARPYSECGGRGCSLHKHQDQTIFTQVGPSHPEPQSSRQTPVPTPVPLTGRAQPDPPPKHKLCQLCKVECNSLEVLNQHNSGKKHMKKLKTFEESQKMSTFEPDKTSASGIQQLPQESSVPSQHIDKVEKGKVEEAEPLCCELCKANCNTLESFNNHLNGKRHQKKLKTFENLNKSQIAVQTEHVFGPQLKPEVHSQPKHESLPSREINEESKVAVEKQQVEALRSTAQVGEKVKACGTKRKTTGGKVSRSVRSKMHMEPPQPKEAILLLCELCNVKCESQVVFQSHIVGKKHLLNAKRFLSENKVLGQEVFQILKHATQTLHGQNVNASQLDHHHQGLLLGQPMDIPAMALAASLESTLVGDISEPLLLTPNFGGGPVMVNGDGIPNEGRSESDCPTGHLVSSETT